MKCPSGHTWSSCRTPVSLTENARSQCSDKLLQIHLHPGWHSALSVAGHTGELFCGRPLSSGYAPWSQHEVPRGRIPRCAAAAELDGSMTLMHVCAAGDQLPHGAPLHMGQCVGPSPHTGFRGPFCDFRPSTRLLASGGSTICLSPLTSVALMKLHRLRSYRGKRRVNLGHETALAC
jgi:hypothetical protein